MPFCRRKEKIMHRAFRGILLGWVIAIIVSACATTTRFTSKPPSVSSPVSVNPFTKENALRQAAERWLGIPYRYGGNDRRGIDCSGLAVQLYKEVFHVSLPRSAAAQRRLGYAVHPPYLKPGDLLFFRFKKDEGIEHVGVYLGNGEFVHASQTHGVIIESLQNSFYRKHLVVIRRVLH
jgi:cell wall-associated NlpC family hydrolase